MIMQANPHRPHRLGSALLFCAGLLAQSGSGQPLDPHPLLETANLSFGFEWSWEPDEVVSVPLPVRAGSPGDSFVQRPLIFEQNQGQTAEEVAFLSRGRGYTLFLMQDEAVMRLEPPTTHEGAERLGLRQPSAAFAPHHTHPKAPEDWRTPKPGGHTAAREESDAAQVLRMRLAGANPDTAVSGQQPQRAKVNYFIGNDPARWRTNIPTFGQVRFAEVYEGIDLVYYGNEGRLEYDFVVAPGADPYQLDNR